MQDGELVGKEGPLAVLASGDCNLCTRGGEVAELETVLVEIIEYLIEVDPADPLGFLRNLQAGR